MLTVAGILLRTEQNAEKQEESHIYQAKETHNKMF